jgi:hypothetical protein
MKIKCGEGKCRTKVEGKERGGKKGRGKEKGEKGRGKKGKRRKRHGMKMKSGE